MGGQLIGVSAGTAAEAGSAGAATLPPQEEEEQPEAARGDRVPEQPAREVRGVEPVGVEERARLELDELPPPTGDRDAIDAFADVSGCEQLFGPPEAIARIPA